LNRFQEAQSSPLTNAKRPLKRLSAPLFGLFQLET
jgi:hypothetical protein